MEVKKYFCVSTDKAANPVNMMGASKRIMEMFVNRQSQEISVSMARFANVAFSDGSLLHSFNNRVRKINQLLLQWIYADISLLQRNLGTMFVVLHFWSK